MSRINLRGRHIEEVLVEPEVVDISKDITSPDDPYLYWDGIPINDTFTTTSFTEAQLTVGNGLSVANNRVTINGVDFDRLMDFLKEKFPDLEGSLNGSD